MAVFKLVTYINFEVGLSWYLIVLTTITIANGNIIRDTDFSFSLANTELSGQVNTPGF